MALICTAMSKAKNHPIVARSSSVMKTAMGVLLTSAVLLLPTVRAEETSGDKIGERQGTQLSKGEIKAQQQFKMLDFNQDGKLSRKEVAIIPKLAAAFDETDTNKDGFLTRDEMPLGHYRGQGGHYSGPGNHFRGQGGGFNRLDTDGDGRISREEAKANPQLGQNFDLIDANKDGYIDRSEMFRHMVICRLYNPGSKLKTADYLERYLHVSYSISKIREFGIRLVCKQLQLPCLFHMHRQCLWFVVKEAVGSESRAQVHDEIMYGAVA